MEYKIISTGSKGNAVVVDGRILIDCGVPFRRLESVYRDLDAVLLTHIPFFTEHMLCCTNLSSTVGIPNGRNFPFDLGMYTRLTALG